MANPFSCEITRGKNGRCPDQHWTAGWLRTFQTAWSKKNVGTSRGNRQILKLEWICYDQELQRMYPGSLCLTRWHLKEVGCLKLWMRRMVSEVEWAIQTHSNPSPATSSEQSRIIQEDNRRLDSRVEVSLRVFSREVEELRESWPWRTDGTRIVWTGWPQVIEFHWGRGAIARARGLHTNAVHHRRLPNCYPWRRYMKDDGTPICLEGSAKALFVWWLDHASGSHEETYVLCDQPSW